MLADTFMIRINCTAQEGAEYSCTKGARGSTIAGSVMLDDHSPKKLPSVLILIELNNW